jgi:hypothetical protein
MADESIEDLRGSLAFTTLTDVLQFLNTTGRTGELWLEGGPDGHAARVFFDRGTVYHAQEGASTGIDALVELLAWVEGTFIFAAEKRTPTVTIEVNLQSALVEAARRLDERRRDIAERDSKNAPQRLIDAFAESSEVLAAIVMDPGGTAIAAANLEEAVAMADLGGDLTALIETVNTLGGHQGCLPCRGFFIEYDRFQLLCLPVAGSVLVVVAPGQAQLGVIRHKTHHLAEALAKVLPD